MKKAILTGFEPFGNYLSNPTKDVVNSFNKRFSDDIEVNPLILPCSYYDAFYRLNEAIKEFKPDIILSLGLASRIQMIRVETKGRNVMYHPRYSDCEGRTPQKEPIIPGAQDFYQVMTLRDARKLVANFCSMGVDAAVSNDAETFVCNSLMYLAAGTIHEQRLPIRFAYIHTPFTDDYRGKVDLRPNKHTIPKEDLQAAVAIALKTLAKP
jgi:pyroglutamyl-peptidase